MVSGTSTAQADAPVDAALAQEFVQFCVDAGALRFGEFKTKAGRMSPYFFNAGLFDDGAKLGRLAQFYAKALVASGIGFDMIFGPAYKGIPLGAAVAIELARLLKGRVLIVDDVMSAGTAARESIALIRAAGATPHAIAIALDRQEKATEVGPDGQVRDVEHSAVQYVQHALGMQVCTIARLADLLQYLSDHTGGEQDAHRERVLAYRQRYGVS